MKILIFSEYYYPERFLIHEIAEKLAEIGHEVSVITGKPNYGFPGGRVLPEYKNVDREVRNGVQIYRCDVYGRRSGTVSLLRNYFSYVRNAKKPAEAIEGEFDVVLCYQLTPILQMLPAIRYCKEHGKPLVCYCLDLAPFSGEKRLRHFRLIKAGYTRLSRNCYRACKAIAVTSKSFIDYLRTVHGIPEQRIVYLPQHASDSLLNVDMKKQPGAETVFLYAGNIGSGARLETVVNAVELLRAKKTEGFRVRFVGEGSCKDKLRSQVSERGLEDLIEFYDGVSMERMPEVYAQADALLVTLRKGQITIPGKLQAYMCTGKPIIGAMDGSGQELIREADCGLCAAAEDAEELAKAMERYLTQPEQFAGKGENGKRFFRKHFTLDRFIGQLEQVLRKAISGEYE